MVESNDRGRWMGWWPSGASIPLVLAALVVLAAACGRPAPVIQGKIIAVDAVRHVIEVEDERSPGTPPLILNIAGAEVGATPAVGDRVRVVYRERGGERRALRVMNLSRQEHMENSAH